MPAYNFQRQFVPFILNGSKPHTIRRRRKRPTRAGDTLQLYVGLRTKRAFKFAEATCVRIEPIIIEPRAGRIVGKIDSTLELLARRDGFPSVARFFHFFEDTYGSERLEDFEIIYWDPKTLKDLTIHLSPKIITGPILGAKADMLIVDDIYASTLTLPSPEGRGGRAMGGE